MKTYDDIMKEITAGLTKDPAHDIPYLQQKAQEYKESEYGREVARACGRLLWDYLSEDDKQSFQDALESDHDGTEVVLEEVLFNLKMGRPQRALELMEPLAEKTDGLVSSGWCKEDSESVYFDFQNVTEEIVWRAHNSEEERDLHLPTEPLTQIYYLYASCLYEVGQYEDAIEQLEKSVSWNPSSTGAWFEIGEIYKRLDDMDGLTALVQIAGEHGDAVTAIQTTLNMYAFTGDEDYKDLAEKMIAVLKDEALEDDEE